MKRKFMSLSLPFDADVLRFMIPAAVVGAVGWAWGVVWLWAPALLAVALLAAFFRDPKRQGPEIEGALWSPADGRVVAIEPNDDPKHGPTPGVKIVIFLSVLDCHINRSPCAGEVESVRHEPGLFLNALDSASSDRNESNWIFMRSGRHAITVRQIAGLIARRIVCRVRSGQALRRGQRIGLIRFGSRTELYLPPQAEIRVRVGDRVAGARTLMAILPH